MKRKTALKTPKPARRKVSGKATLQQNVAPQFREYLSAQFTQSLTQHMKRAKQAALQGKE